MAGAHLQKEKVEVRTTSIRTIQMFWLKGVKLLRKKRKEALKMDEITLRVYLREKEKQPRCSPERRAEK